MILMTPSNIFQRSNKLILKQLKKEMSIGQKIKICNGSMK